ncbi:MAG: cation diffusion facilitator family transporter [Lachnospiraceae bacterium]|nr:cation diffusion facilitator family transporter [Lachnospiraceae bacterium]
MKDERLKHIVRASLIGIMLNVMLATSKAIIGLLSNSIAIVVDAVNNLTDVISSSATLIGAKIAGRGSDKNHPLGHGRAEYISSLAIGMVIVYAGITSFSQSVEWILNPKPLDYGAKSFIVLSVAILFKIFISIYYTKVGKAVNSASLLDSAKDAIFDIVIDAVTIVSALLYFFTEIKTEYYLSAIISVFIIRTGVVIIKDTIVRLLGERVDSEITKKVIGIIDSNFPEVYGAYDLILHNYGPQMFIGSVHIEVSENENALNIDRLARRIESVVFEETGVVIEAVGIYAISENDKVAKIRNEVRKLVTNEPYVLQMHGFYLDEDNMKMSYDIVMDLDAKDVKKEFFNANKIVREHFPDYDVVARMDVDISDI